MKRNLKFWSRYTWDSSCVELGVVAVLAVFAVIGAEGLNWSLLASVIPYFLVAVGSFCMIMINHSCQILYVPLLISMGEPRRNIFFGFHYYRLLITTATLALCALIWALVPGQVSAMGLRSLPTILAVLVISASLGSLMGTAFSRWKWVSVLVILLLAGGVGGVAGFTAVNGIHLEQAATLQLVGRFEKLPWWLAAAAAVLFAVDAAFHWILLRRQEVKL